MGVAYFGSEAGASPSAKCFNQCNGIKPMWGVEFCPSLANISSVGNWTLDQTSFDHAKVCTKPFLALRTVWRKLHMFLDNLKLWVENSFSKNFFDKVVLDFIYISTISSSISRNMCKLRHKLRNGQHLPLKVQIVKYFFC